MIYVFADRPSRSARVVARILEGKRLRRPIRLKDDSVVLAWGSDVEWASAQQRGTILQQNLQLNKLNELIALELDGIRVPPFRFEAPPPQEEGWLPRRVNHSHGRDFLEPPALPAFWTKKLELTEEYRVHVFRFSEDDTRILRWGKKVPRHEQAHPWVRSDEAGWRLSYGLPSESLPKGIRPAAKAAVNALRYDWGAVDIGLTSDGKPVVLEVNSAPGLDEGGQTILRYAEAIKERLGKGSTNA